MLGREQINVTATGDADADATGLNWCLTERNMVLITKQYGRVCCEEDPQIAFSTLPVTSRTDVNKKR